jgi:integrase
LERIAATVAASNSFKAVADEWLKKAEREGRAPTTMKKLRWLLNFTNESIGRRPIASISAHELLLMLRKMESNGRYETAKALRTTFSQIFRYAIATARAERDVATDLRGALMAPQVVHRAAITTPKEAGGLLRAIEGFKGFQETKAALKLLANVFVRPGELRFAEWQEFDFDNALWTIPAQKMKMRHSYSVPLSRQALASSGQSGTMPATANICFLHFVRWQSRCPKTRSTQLCGVYGFAQDEMTGHGFRAMAATLLNEMGMWNPDAIERQLAHCDNNSVRRAYTRGEYWNERIRMMQHWSDHLDLLQGGVKGSKGRV